MLEVQFGRYELTFDTLGGTDAVCIRLAQRDERDTRKQLVPLSALQSVLTVEDGTGND